MNQIQESRWNIVAKRVSPARIGLSTVATTFQIKYKETRFTVTNLHVCRIPNMLRLRARNARNVRRVIKKQKPVNDPSLKDSDLIGQELVVGDYPKRILAIDKFHDLCLLEPDLNKPYFTLASSYRIGEKVTIIGFPRGLPKTIRRGRLFTEKRGYFPWLKRNVKYIYASTLAYPGNSGSPVINKYGNVVGVLFGGLRGIHTEALIVPLNALRDFLEKEY